MIQKPCSSKLKNKISKKKKKNLISIADTQKKYDPFAILLFIYYLISLM